MALPADLNMTDVQLAVLCRKQDAEIERLRAVLKPFAEVAREWDGEPESLEVELRAYDDKMCPGVSVADFRRAAEALRDEQKPQQTTQAST